MEVQHSPETKKKYDKSKYKIKKWEQNFKKKYGRVPSKLDIREADNNIRYAYKVYFNIKSAMIAKSFMDVDGFFSDEETQNESTKDETSTTTYLDDTVVANEDTFCDDLNDTEATTGFSDTISFSENIDTNNVKGSACLKGTDDPFYCSSFMKSVPNFATSTFKDDSEAENLNTDKTWGAHLNQEIKKVEEKKETPKMNVNKSFTQKLFSGSKFSKRNPRKSLSFSHRRSESNLDSQQFLSQPDPPPSISDPPVPLFQDNLASSDVNLFKSNVKIVGASQKVQSTSISAIQSVMDNSYKTRRTLDTGWIKRMTANAGTSLDGDSFFASGDFAHNSHDMSQPLTIADSTRVEYDSDDVIEESDEEENSKSLGHILKRRKIETSLSQPVLSSYAPAGSFQNKKLDFSNIFNKNQADLTERLEHKFKESLEHTKEKFKSERNDTFENKAETLENNVNTVENKVLENNKKTLENNKKTLENNKKTRENIEKTFADKLEKLVDDTKTSENKMKVTENRTSTPTTLKRTGRITRSQSDVSFGSTSLSSTSNKAPISETFNMNGIKDKRQQAREKLEKKIASGGLNDNFVQVNLKKKIYVRGKKGINFSKYKKQQWKNKKKALAGPDMDMGGCDGGMLTCFQCGKVGHFARQCKETKGDTLLPLEADEEVCPYPTLEEAANMAKDDKLMIRNPNLKASQSESTESNCIAEEGPEDIDKEEINKDAEYDFDGTDEEAILTEALRLEEFANEIEMKRYMDNTTFVKPYYDQKEDGNLIDTPQEVFDILQMFGHTSFRPGQEQAIMRILSGKSTLVTLSTGSGKSLCYQLPAYLYRKREPCISLIISPLVSLMEDQVTGIPHLLRAACLHNNQTKPQREKIIEALSAGELSILLISPEAVVAGEKSTGFTSILKRLPPIAFACIDEAHCVSQWSHNFRPSYLMICRILRERLGVKTILGLTATATRATCDSIIEHLQIPDGRDGIISDRPLPNNLRLSVSKDGNRDNALLSLLLSEQFSEFKSIIIYCIRRQECERIASFLRTSLKYEAPKTEIKSKKRKRLNVQAEPYHAGLSASRRRTIQKSFMSNQLRIVVATVAFGMGINKIDLRAVIHYNMPKNFESYVQEIGRAGRDGLPAHCHLFLDSQERDECELERHIHSNSMDRHVIRKLLEKIFIPCSCKGTCQKHEVAFSIEDTVRALDIPEEIISTLLCYLELHDNRYIEVLTPGYVTCKVISYGGQMQIRKAAKDCPPLAMGLALHKGNDDSVLEFPIVEVASAIGWDSGMCKHKLKNLEWINVNNQPKRSTLTVQFSNLGLRLLAPGNLTGDQLDEALDNLYERVMNQEKTALLQLHALHSTLVSVALPSYRSCLDEELLAKKETVLKEKIREYFDSSKPLDILPEKKPKPVCEEQVCNDVKSLVYMYRDNVFTGRAVARIFHGIQSPNYPAVIWGRCRFWRSHMTEDFNTLCRIATAEILKMR